MKVLVIQPTVPHYRLAFFKGIAQKLPGAFLLHASSKIPGGPDSLPSSALPSVEYNPNFQIITIGHQFLYWQKGLNLRGFTKGDVLFIAGNPRFLSNFIIVFKARLKGMGVIIQGHGWSSSSNKFTAWLRRQLWKMGQVVFLYTDEERLDFIKKGFAPDKVFAANNTIGTDEIKKSLQAWKPEQVEIFKKEKGLTANKLLLFCGRLTEKSEFHVLLHALKHLKKNNPELRLVVVGTGPLESDCHELSVELDLEKTIIWLGEIHDELQLAPWFLSASMFVYPGPIGLSLLHAFNYGLPVVTHDELRQHNPEIAALEPGKNGALFKRGDAESLAECLTLLINSPDIIEAMRIEAFDTVKNRFNTEMMVDRFMQAVKMAHSLTRHGQS